MNFSDKVVCVTGAGGSIGSEICKQLILQGVKELVLVSLTESGLYRTTTALSAIKRADQYVTGILGSVLDHRLMLQTLKGVNLVIHAAAHKHVPICESNPLAAIETNTIGTAVLVDAARANAVSDFIFISTDKAVKPSSVMGMSKRFAELILRDHAQTYINGRPVYWDGLTSFRIVRFGNVLDSDGSVLPLWRKQIAAGGPVTLTDKRCTRYFMSIPQAAELVLGVLDLPPSIGPFVFDMGEPVNMYDLARETMNAEMEKPDNIRRYTQPNGVTYMPTLVETGLRPGEKLTEELAYEGSVHPTANPKINVIEEKPARLRSHTLVGLMDAVRERRTTDALQLLWSVK